MNPFVTVAKKIRHAPGLRHAEGLWRAVRRPYEWLLDPTGRGVKINLGGRPVRLPADVIALDADWSVYEIESFGALARWLDRHPGGAQVLDIGSAFGIFATFALQISPRTELYALESDLASLKAMERLVPPAALPRLHRLRALLGSEHTPPHDLPAALAATRSALAAFDPALALEQRRFICLGDETASAIPHYSLDALFAAQPPAGPLLLKCDVEGAELLVLRGARQLLARARPTMLLSVHPGALPDFGQSPADVEAFLRENGYRWQVIARDHEEHWWCEPVSQ
ncbi:MAG: FkbM family methyltransferase [Verrucomicrobia bacterium]|nr:FkbM family methyltransferase [Verrucomicrobiota bacterium]